MSDVTSEARVMRCPECGRVASVPEWCARPVCVHAWDGCTPEVWDGDNTNGEGRHIEQSPNEEFRSPGPGTWAEMVALDITPEEDR